MAAPQAGVAHPVTLGSTFQRNTDAGSFCLLRYDFKPASASAFQPGRLEVDPATSRVRTSRLVIRASSWQQCALLAPPGVHLSRPPMQAVVELPDSGTGQSDLVFHGRYERSRDDCIDVVALFDEDTGSWHFEVVDSVVKTLKATQRRGPVLLSASVSLCVGQSSLLRIAHQVLICTRLSSAWWGLHMTGGRQRGVLCWTALLWRQQARHQAPAVPRLLQSRYPAQLL